MKKLIATLLIFASAAAFATYDYHGNIFILTQHVQSGEYFVTQAPIIGCAGGTEDAELVQLTREYKVPSNLGCGKIFSDNINALSCASVDSSTSGNELVLDISNCSAKNDQSFVDGIEKVVKMNFSNLKSLRLKN